MTPLNIGFVVKPSAGNPPPNLADLLGFQLILVSISTPVATSGSTSAFLDQQPLGKAFVLMNIRFVTGAAKAVAMTANASSSDLGDMMMGSVGV